MKLYHFTARHLWEQIQRQGITRGFLITHASPLQMTGDYRWLTTNPDWEQTWAEGTGRLPYKRNEVRLTVDIPDHEMKRILKWETSGPIISEVYEELSDRRFCDPDNWRLFTGDIPASWIVAHDFLPTKAEAIS